MHDVISLLINRYDFFLQLLWEHIEISVLASVVAIIIGGLLRLVEDPTVLEEIVAEFNASIG